MHVNHKIHMDLTRFEPIPTLEMVQHDQLSRKVEIHLYCENAPFDIPVDTGVMIHYLRGDGISGIYDTMADGSLAWSASGNVLTLSIAPEILMTEGTAAVSARLIRGVRTLNTFTFLIQVHKGVPVGEGTQEHRLCWYLPTPPTAARGQYLAVAEVDENGVVTALTAVDGPEIDYTLGIWGQLYAQKLRVTGQFSTDSSISVSFNGNRLQKVGTPTADTDAANKSYVDTAIANALSSL